MTDKEIENFITFCQDALMHFYPRGFSIEHKYVKELLGDNYASNLAVTGDIIKELGEKGIQCETVPNGDGWDFFVRWRPSVQKMTKTAFNLLKKHTPGIE